MEFQLLVDKSIFLSVCVSGSIIFGLGRWLSFKWAEIIGKLGITIKTLFLGVAICTKKS